MAAYAKLEEEERGPGDEGERNLAFATEGASLPPFQDDCRICYGDGSEERLLRTLCHCRRPVHASCLNRWLVQRQKVLPIYPMRPSCEVCLGPFPLECKPRRRWHCPKIFGRDHNDELLLMTVALGAFVLCLCMTIWAFTSEPQIFYYSPKGRLTRVTDAPDSPLRTYQKYGGLVITVLTFLNLLYRLSVSCGTWFSTVYQVRVLVPPEETELVTVGDEEKGDEEEDEEEGAAEA